MSGPVPLLSTAADIMPPDLAADLDTVAGRVRERLGSVTANVIEIGRDLQNVKKSLPHGQFVCWVEIACGLSRRMAQLMMKAAHWAQGKSETVTLLEPTTIYLLAAPSTPETVSKTVLSRVKAGEVIAPQVVKDMIRAEKRAQGQECERSTSAKKRRAQQEARQTGRTGVPDDCHLDVLMAAWSSADEKARSAFLQEIGAILTPQPEVTGQIEGNAGPPSVDPPNTFSEPPRSEPDEAGKSLELACPNNIKAERDQLIELFEKLGPNSQKWARWWAPAGAPSEDTSNEVIRTTDARAPFRAAYPNASPVSQAAFLQYLEGRPEHA